ncbi:MAG: GLPGLI family protein [Saprospiraceae bacterium]|nr:GLPGLI family protein [Saprospiraceae bacterium]
MEILTSSTEGGPMKINNFFKLGIIINLIIRISFIHAQCYSFIYKQTTKFPDFAVKEFVASSTGIPYSLYSLNTNGIISEYKYLKSNPESGSFRLMDLNYFKDNRTGEIVLADFMDKDRIGTILKAIEKTSWKISKDTTSIKGLKVKKATNFDKYNNKITAYYSTDFSINDGPCEYNNLPGLIVKIESTSQTIELTEIQVNENCIIPLPGSFNIKWVSNEEWDKHSEKTLEGFIKK